MEILSFFEAIKKFVATWPLDTVVAGGFGAFFGALGAQLIISRSHGRQAAAAELNSVATAQTLCFSICNVFLALKRQHVRPMAQRYDEVRAAHKTFLETARQGQPRVFEFQADLQTLSPIKTPHILLENIFLERVGVRGRALAAAIQLFGAIDGLEKSMLYRNQLIAELREMRPLSPEELAAFYLGLRIHEGIVDERFRMSVEAIARQTDDCIFFSRIVAEDLDKYGRKLLRGQAWRLRFGLPKTSEIDWKVAEDRGLFPSTDKFRDWMRGFATRPSWSARMSDWLKARFK